MKINPLVKTGLKTIQILKVSCFNFPFSSDIPENIVTECFLCTEKAKHQRYQNGKRKKIQIFYQKTKERK